MIPTDLAVIERLNRKCRRRGVCVLGWEIIPHKPMLFLTRTRCLSIDNTGATQQKVGTTRHGEEDPHWRAVYVRTHAMAMAFASDRRRRGEKLAAFRFVGLARRLREITQRAAP